MKTAGTKQPKSVSRFTLHESASASALIIAVILTSLLAIVGMMFIMMARVDKMATSAISENKELNSAVETVVAKISQELVLDVPGMPKGEDYYDYPDAKNAWLASLEPYEKTAGNYYWRQISDVYNKFGPVELGLKAAIIPDNQKPSDVGDSNSISGYSADADGDGVADSNWVIIPDMTSNKVKPIYAAIRIVDNGGMLNVNTAYKFDPTVGPTDANLIDGSSQTQVNLLALSGRGSTSNPLGRLDDARFGDEPLPHLLGDYIRNVVWRYNEPNGTYTPFDIGDELKLRNRYILNYNLMTSRIEGLWTKVYDWGLYDPRTDPVKFVENSENGRDYWFFRTYNGSADPNIYDYRHISTTYNMDRIIKPDCNKMANINTADVNELYSSIRRGLLDTNYIDVNIAAQIAVNIIDYRDSDSDVTSFTPDINGPTYYGFERPCVYISELTRRFKPHPPSGPYVFPGDFDMSYAIELCKPYSEDGYPKQCRLDIQGYGTVDVNWTGTKHFHVIYFKDPCCTLTINFDLGDTDSNLPPGSPTPQTISIGTGTQVFWPLRTISLQRQVGAGWITVDSITVPIVVNWFDVSDTPKSIQRDITPLKCIRRLWGSNLIDPNLGYGNSYIDPNLRMIQAHPENKPFTNVGEIGMVFRKSAYSQIGPADTEADVRLDLADPNFQQLFKYLTVIDPCYHITDPNKLIGNETKIKGRININTAPWYVIAQLPWVSQRVGYNNPALAQAIASYRDTVKGFKSIGESMNVAGMDYYETQTGDLTGFPDLTTLPTGGDGAPDDFEERDVIFARISNLVTVRSDVFTAYILVRIGTDGPQKRVIAILDRSNVRSGNDKVRIIALHPVPDPR